MKFDKLNMLIPINEAFDFNNEIKVEDELDDNYLWLNDMLYNNFLKLFDYDYIDIARLEKAIAEILKDNNKINEAIINIFKIAKKYKIIDTNYGRELEFREYSISFLRTIRNLFRVNRKFNPLDYSILTIALLYLFCRGFRLSFVFKISISGPREIEYIKFDFSYYLYLRSRNLANIISNYRCTSDTCPELINIINKFYIKFIKSPSVNEAFDFNNEINIKDNKILDDDIFKMYDYALDEFDKIYQMGYEEYYDFIKNYAAKLINIKQEKKH